jgi:hypothetical protein
MKQILLAVCAVLFAGMATMAAPAFAEEATSAGLKPDDVKSALGLSIYLQGGYIYNDKASAGDENDLRWLDHKANNFNFDLAEIIFQKEAAAGAVGFKVKISVGETAKLIHAAGLGTQPTGTANPESFDITEAMVSYIVPVGSGLSFDFGKMGTFVGAEVMEAIDNPTYSRSFLFDNAEPLTHTGLKIGYSFTEAVSAALFVVNGWDNAVDDNAAKSIGLSLGLAPVEMFSASVNVIQGPEQMGNSRDDRTLIDIVATINPIKLLSIILNYDDGREEMGAGLADVKWSGLSGIVMYEFTDTYSLAVRGEYFDDKDGFRTGTTQKLTEVTISPEIKLDGGLVLKPEYRHDASDKQSFANGTKKSQDTIALGVMYSW